MSSCLWFSYRACSKGIHQHNSRCAFRIEDQTQSTNEELKMKDLKEPQDSSAAGGTTHAPPPAEPLPTHNTYEEEEQTKEEDVEDEDLKAPVELKMEFLRAVKEKDFQQATKLCQTILVYEPDNPVASEFLLLIQKKLLEEQEAEQSSDEDEEEEDEDSNDEDDKDDNSDSDEESFCNSSCSSSSCSSSSSDDDEDKNQVNRHKPCPPSHISP
ncbi:glutamate-rich protein 2 isoform X1 [Amphiprion ocellaris]|uniref:glutamate-rich protein 2 isoform X1 n=1 Tax=Amphiprion ocellaris TaxID=80972 RepID=UPI000C301151|nr:glutamate-rich protein 2 isoform X1 [Amphiprion ocellaris]